ncbi:MAG TPA: hypothetical protein VE650_20065 [Acetobacteraceae bacterium]|nr:hypothetical protein [Acetobacteraceae bacterium]
MGSMTRRSAFALFASALAGPIAAKQVFAQSGATNAPPGGIPSTTAPSNSQGTPAGGSGDVSGTRVGPRGTTAAVPPPAGLAGDATPGTGTGTTTQRQTRRVRHRTRRRQTTTPSDATQSQ